MSSFTTTHCCHLTQDFQLAKYLSIAHLVYAPSKTSFDLHPNWCDFVTLSHSHFNTLNRHNTSYKPFIPFHSIIIGTSIAILLKEWKSCSLSMEIISVHVKSICFRFDFPFIDWNLLSIFSFNHILDWHWFDFDFPLIY